MRTTTQSILQVSVQWFYFQGQVVQTDPFPDHSPWDSFLSHSGTSSNHASTESQWHWFPPTNAPISWSEALTSPPRPKQLANPSVRTPGGEESAQKRFKEARLTLPVQPAYTHFGNVRRWKSEKRLDFLLLRVKCQISSLFRFILEFLMFQEKEWLLMAERSYCVVELSLTFSLTDCGLQLHDFGYFWILDTSNYS